MNDPTTDVARDAPDAPDDRDVPGGGRSPGGRRWWPPWRHVDRSVLIVTAIVALGFVVMLRGVLAGVTGDERTDLPDEIEEISPVPDAVQVLSQSNVFVDLTADHTGVLVIDGTEIETVGVDELGSVQVQPGEQVDLPPVTIYEPGNATLTFTPGDDAPIEEFAEGLHRVQVIYWPVDEGRERARSYTWTFSVV